eukprot:jgi/Tetstr1/432138/TSEL_021595.t1
MDNTRLPDDLYDSEGTHNPGLWNPRNDEWDCYLTDEKKHATRDEYRHLLCYGVFTASGHAVLRDAVATLPAENATARDTADADDLFASAICTIATCYSRFFDTTAAERSNNGVDGLLNAMDDKRFEVSLHQAAKAQAAAQFKGNGSGRSGDGSGGSIRIKEQERAKHADRCPSPASTTRCIIDIRVLNSYRVRKRLKIETLLGVRHLTKKGNYIFSFDLQDGFYALGIAEADRDYFTVDVQGQLYRLAGLPMRWSLSPYYLVTLTQVFIAHLRKPKPEPPLIVYIAHAEQALLPAY